MNDVKEFVIDRSKWCAGHLAWSPGSEEFPHIKRINSKLLREDGKMCCLGFYALTCGLRETSIDRRNMPSDVYEVGTTTWPPQWLLDEEEAISLINDDDTIPDADRERLIIGKFANHGIHVSFTGEFPKKEAA